MEQNKIVANENFDWNAFENDLGVYNLSKDEIAEAYGKTMSNVAVGEVVEGMDVVDAISWVSVYEGRPRENVFIKKITVINDAQ